MIIILYDEALTDSFQRQVLPLFPAAEVAFFPFDRENVPDIENGSTVVTYLSDRDLKTVLEHAAKRHWRIGLLPHPAMPHARVGFGITSRLDDAAEDILSREGEEHVDLLTCNGHLVLNAVVVGEPFTETPGINGNENLWQRFRRFYRLIHTLRSAAPTRYTISTAKEKTIETAALGLIAVEHGRSAILSRRIIEDSAVTDGMLHLLIYAPHSALRMLWFLLAALLLPARSTPHPLPSFVGHIKSESIRIISAGTFTTHIDHDVVTTNEILLTVRRGELMLIPGRYLDVQETNPDQKEIFRTKGIPEGDKLDAMRGRPLPWIHRASPEEFRDLFQILRENARTSESYIVLIILSTLLATFGLFADSAPVIIGAMILAPLMSPIVAMGMGILRTSDGDLLWRSFRSFLIGVVAAVTCTVIVTWLTPLRTINSEIAARLNPTLLDMGIAVVSGVAGAYAHARSSVARSLAGVAIAVALVPPLAVCGIGLGWGDFSVFRGAGLLFITNFVGMILAAAATFLVLGFSPFTYSRRGLSISVTAVLVVSILLVPSFMRMVDEHRIIRILDDRVIESATIQDIQIRHAQPIHISVRLLASDPIDQFRIDLIKNEIERLIDRAIVLEARIAIVR